MLQAKGTIPVSQDQDKPLGDPFAESDDFRRGFTAGYQARVQEEVRDYFASLTAGREIYDRVIKGLVELPTAAERERTRLLVVREGHDAGLHEDGRIGCPWCAERHSESDRHHSGHYGAASDPLQSS